MATSRLGSAVVGYNVQTAVDAKQHRIAAHEVTNDVTDRGLLSTMANAAKQAAAHPKPIVLADRSYFEGYQILDCKQAGIAAMVPRPLTSGGKFEGRFDKRGFIYDSRRDVYRCPAGGDRHLPVHCGRERQDVAQALVVRLWRLPPQAAMHPGPKPTHQPLGE